MKKFIKGIITNMAIYSIILTALFIFLRNKINSNNMEFRNGTYIAAIIILTIFFLIGIIQIICKIKDNLIKIFIILTILTLVSVTGFIIYLFYDLEAPVEQVVNKEGKIFVVHEYSYVSTKLEYYEYINSFIRGKNVVLTEEHEKDESNSASTQSVNSSK